MKDVLPKAYDGFRFEDAIYRRWEESGYFNPDKLPGKRREPFSIAMPPPNATGILHIGHALFLTIQDIVIRFQRMLGKKALWLPGTDHAAIATQAKVEKILKEEGKDKYALGREKFLERVNEFVQGSQKTIRKQIRKMGSSCDWSRERYTLDEGLARAVREAFVRMYEDGLIYRGERIVNWCPRCESTLSDDEVEYREQKTKFYYFKYGPVVIGTARPETKFLDKTIIVHPKDKRYAHLHGKSFVVEWIGGKVQAHVIADPLIDMNFGTGAMTITPAHSFEDFDLAKKYKLPIVKIIDEKGNFTDAAGEFAGKNARASRDTIVEILKKKNFLEKIDENYIHNLSVCYRCETPVEPLPKDQWWIDVNKKLRITNYEFKYSKKDASLKELALWVVKSGKIKITPKRFEKIYFQWMENLRDWCISRQIWFGHRIPVYYCKREIPNPKSQNPNKSQIPKSKSNWKFGMCPPIVSIDTPKSCPECGNTKLEQDPDTLDTWFSSGLWTFSTLGWPNQTKDLKTFHPTSFMETGYDIIFFWVARMILMSMYHMGEVPFHEVYLHGLVRDKEGRKMSKSLGNVIDPLDVCKKYGTDAVRLSLVIGNASGNDLNLGEEKIAGFRNFTNKLWNISRYIFLTVEKVRRVPKPPKPRTIFDRWILGRFHEVAKKVTEHLEKHEFSQAGEKLRDFTWGEFADWYIEISKITNYELRITNKSAIRNPQSAINNEILLYILERLLILWHPFMPYVTEVIWKEFSDELLIIQPWPKARAIHKSSADISDIQNIIIAIRNRKSENKLANKRAVRVVIVTQKAKKILKDSQAVIEKLAGALIEFSRTKPAKSISAVVGDTEIHIPLSGIMNGDAQRRERAQKEEYARKLESRLNNQEFLKKAPKKVIDAERQKLKEAKQEIEKLRQNYE